MASLKASRRAAANIAFTGFCWVAAAIALTALTAILWSLVVKGGAGMNLDVFTMSTPAAGERGGLLNAIVGSVIMCSIAMAMALVIGIMAGTWLAEFARGSMFGEVVRFLNDILLSAPSVLVGLFVWIILVNPFHGFSALAGSVALALLAVPIIVRTTEDVLKLQPPALREAGLALGAPYWLTISSILWKSAGSGILTAALLAFARISGETAPLLFTALSNQFNSLDLTKPMASLPVVIFNFALTPYDDLQRLAWAASLLIAVTVLGINVAARFATREQKRS
jgi:phosphate transport system permease protein